MVLCCLIKNISNGSVSAEVGYEMGSLVESLFSYLLRRGDQFESLPNHLEAAENGHGVLQQPGLILDADGLRRMLMTELESRCQESSHLCASLKVWKNTPGDDASGIVVKKIGQKASTETFRSSVRVKIIGREFDQFRRELRNG